VSVYVMGAIYCDTCGNFVATPLRHSRIDSKEVVLEPACELPGWQLITEDLSRCPRCVADDRKVERDKPDPRPIAFGRIVR
jgi:hypothetical protein